MSPTWYAPKPWRLQEEAQGKSCLVVEKRAEKVAAEYVRKAQHTDQTYCGTAPGTVGPVEARLRTFDKTVPLVFGAFGEASAAVEQLIDALAEAGADVHWRAMKAKKREEAKGALVWQLRRRWGMAAIRGNARLILDRMQFVEYGGRADSQVAKMRGCPRRARRRERALELSWFGPSIAPRRGDAVDVSPIEADRACFVCVLSCVNFATGTQNSRNFRGILRNFRGASRGLPCGSPPLSLLIVALTGSFVWLPALP